MFCLQSTELRVRDASLRYALLVVLLMIQQLQAVVYPSIHWTPKNPIFLKDEDSRTMNVLSMSRVKIVCPNPTTILSNAQDVTATEYLYENFWIVTRKSYDKCNTTLSSRNRLLLKCDTPRKLKFYTIRFQRFSATAQGLEFAPGNEYYFIATSSGTKNSLDSTSGGNCLRGNMRIKFYVCTHAQDPRCLPPTTPPTPTPNTPVKCTTESHPTTTTTTAKPTKLATDSNVIPDIPTARSKQHTDPGLQSDDPKPTLRPSLEPVTSSRPDVTQYSRKQVGTSGAEPCRHDHGMRPSWSIIIPLLVIIVLLIATNILFVYQLKQIYPSKNSKDLCENLEKRHHPPRVSLSSFNFKGRLSTKTKDECGPENV